GREAPALTRPNQSAMSLRQDDSCSFEYLVGAARQGQRHVDAERLGGFEVDEELDLGCLLDRQLGGLLALDKPAGMDSCPAVCVPNVRSVAHQTAGRRELAPFVDCRHPVVDGYGGELFAMAGEKRLRADDESACSQFDHLCEDTFEVTFAAGIEDMELQPKGVSCRQHLT